MLSEVLQVQNFFWRGIVKDIIPRLQYMDHLQKGMAQKEVQVIIGARRVGKTYLMYDLIQKLILGGVDKTHILYCILNDYDLRNYSIKEIIREFRTINRINLDDRIYVFLDEIQHVPDWDQQVANLYDSQNIKLIVSGSSSLLIQNQSTFLTGRQLKYPIYPLNFEEFLLFSNYKPKAGEEYLYQNYLMEYLEYGGFPDMVINKNTQYLVDLVDAVLFKDVVSVYKLEQPRLIKEILIWLSTHLRQSTSYSKLTKVLGQKSDVTIKQYIGYLQDVYQILELKRFSLSLGEQMTSPKKYYFYDLGVRNCLINQFRDFGSLAENALYLHLCANYKKENVFYYYENQLEVDFVVKSGEELLAFESKFLSSIEASDKGLSGLNQLINKEGINLTKKYVITKDLEKIENGIEFVPLYKLLLTDKKLSSR